MSADDLESNILSDDRAKKLKRKRVNKDVLVPEKEKTDVQQTKQKKQRSKVEGTRTKGFEDSPAMGLQPAFIQADFIASMQKKYLKDLTSLELDTLQLPQYAFKDSTEFTLPRNPLNLAEYIKFILGSTGSLDSVKSKGSPVVLVLSPCAVHITNLIRGIKSSKITNLDVGKLFSRHININEQQKWLDSHLCSVVIGTPNRVLKLMESGHLLNNHLKCVIIDTAFRDGKMRSIWDMPECALDLVNIFRRDDMNWKRLKLAMF